MKARGLMLAKVTNVKDPENRNRVKCEPIISDKDLAQTDWCYCVSPMAGKNYGMQFHPQINDYVLIGYLGDDIHHPIVIGSYWEAKEDVTYQINDGKNDIRSIKTPSGIEIKMDDTDKKQKITIVTPTGASIEIDDGNTTASIKDKESENKLQINWKSGEITLAAKTKLTLSAGDSSITLESGGDITAKSSKSVSVTGTDIALKGNSSFKAEGGTVDLNAQGKLTASATGDTTIKGAMVNIN